MARRLQHSKASALGALECTEFLGKRMEALRDDKVVENMLHKVSTTAGLKMPDERMKKTPVRYRHTAEPEAAAQHSWRCEFFEAVDLVTEQLKRRFDQDGMKPAALREKVVIQAAKKEHTFYVDSLHLPVHFDRGRLEMQLKMIGDVFGASPGNTVQDIAENMSKLQPQTRAVFKEAENLIKLCLCLPISAASSERTFSALRRLKTWLRTTMTQKRLTHLALMHVHGHILDSLDIDSLMRSFISANPERKATFGVV